MDDIDELELEDEEWCDDLNLLEQNRDLLEFARNGRTFNSPIHSIETRLDDHHIPKLQDLSEHQDSSDIALLAKAASRPFLSTISWRMAIDYACRHELNESAELIDKQIGQILGAYVSEKTSKMILLVDNIASNGNGSAFARVKDLSGELNCAVHRSAMIEFPNIREGSTLLIDNATIFAPCAELTCLVLMAQNIHKVFTEIPEKI